MPLKATSQTKLLMGMPITVEMVAVDDPTTLFKQVFALFTEIDNRYSPYKPDSEVSQINTGLDRDQWSNEMKTVMTLCEQTKQQTNGYFDVYRHGQFDPSGLVKGWAIQRAAQLLLNQGAQRFYVEAGGDVQVEGLNADDQPWHVGIRNPFKRTEIVKVLAVQSMGIATSGAYIRGPHIYNPHQPDTPLTDVASLTVIGPNIYEADRFVTAAYAMGTAGIDFIESLPGLEAYMINDTGIATMTSHFEDYTLAA